MKVLHDWDRNTRYGSLTLRRGLCLVLYGLSRKFLFLNRFGFVKKNALNIEGEQADYMETLIKLNMIAGVTPIFGIRDEIRAKHGNRINEFEKKYRADIRRHVHVGEAPDPNRMRYWEPPLEHQDIINQRRDSWHFDAHYAKGNKINLLPGEIPIFHIDRPDWLSFYIYFLHFN